MISGNFYLFFGTNPAISTRTWWHPRGPPRCAAASARRARSASAAPWAPTAAPRPRPSRDSRPWGSTWGVFLLGKMVGTPWENYDFPWSKQKMLGKMMGKSTMRGENDDGHVGKMMGETWWDGKKIGEHMIGDKFWPTMNTHVLMISWVSAAVSSDLWFHMVL